jgi:hypothetical protein
MANKSLNDRIGSIVTEVTFTFESGVLSPATFKQEFEIMEMEDDILVGTPLIRELFPNGYHLINCLPRTRSSRDQYSVKMRRLVPTMMARQLRGHQRITREQVSVNGERNEVPTQHHILIQAELSAREDARAQSGGRMGVERDEETDEEQAQALSRWNTRLPRAPDALVYDELDEESDEENSEDRGQRVVRNVTSSGTGMRVELDNTHTATVGVGLTSSATAAEHGSVRGEQMVREAQRALRLLSTAATDRTVLPPRARIMQMRRLEEGARSL